MWYARLTDSCGSGLARESGGSFRIEASGLTLSLASQLPQGMDYLLA
jgi:hypothetical protein